MVFGNIYYTYMGLRLAKKEDRNDVTALPYGVNTPAAFAFVFSIISPVIFAEGCDAKFPSPLTSQNEAEEYFECWNGAVEKAWAVGVSANMIVGIVSVFLGIGGDLIVKFTPTATLLTSLAGIGIAFLGLAQLTLTFANPIVGIFPLYLMVMGYFAGMRFTGPVPMSLVIILVGVILGAADDVVTSDTLKASKEFVESYGLTFATESFSSWGDTGPYIGTIVPLALAAAAGTLMNVISAKRAGDDFPLKEAMISDGVGTMVGALFGTPFGTSVYIGHPAYKKFGAGVGYSLINCVVFFFCSIFGFFAIASALVPQGATAPLLLYVGFSICKEALEEMPSRQFPTFLIGILPALADYAATLSTDIDLVGLLALAKSSILLALVTSTIWWYIIERELKAAAAWTFGAALLAAFGVIHQPEATADKFNEQQADGSALQSEQWRFMTGYLMVAFFLVILGVAQAKGWIEGPQEKYVPEYLKDASPEDVEVEPVKASI
eukprot:CAMPEP_0184033226 /NCGR_PEP_ID=MMETSP0955-20130417/3614_1 /TAXON_ID=627963 /ORGANISM="Aplanochytrium sp, Strain PBS07" /LENGTH=492 /DNA_ID=CAMNT_0026319529 /DNA_START=361 /DNA_END=1839 /DNA_ORIENTATION=-